MFDNLTKDNILLYAIKNYQNPSCQGIEEFYDDLKKLNYIKKLLNKYKTTGNLKERLILNHLIVLYNCFGPFATEMLFFKLPEYEDCLKPFLLFLNFLPEQVNGKLTVDIPLDTVIVERLRAI